MDLSGIALRVSITYLYLLILLRLAGNRVVHEATPFDLVVALIIADTPGNIMAGALPVSQGIVGMGTLMLLHLIVQYLSYRSSRFDRWVASAAEPLLARGKLVSSTLRRQRINEENVAELLRHEALEREEWPDVEEALLEPDGKVSLKKGEAARAAEKRDAALLREALS